MTTYRVDCSDFTANERRRVLRWWRSVNQYQPEQYAHVASRARRNDGWYGFVVYYDDFEESQAAVDGVGLGLILMKVAGRHKAEGKGTNETAESVMDKSRMPIPSSAR